MARTRDLYEVLGVGRDASQEEIKRAYRRLAREYHPDVSSDPEAEHKIKEINLAYQTLSDPARRRQYDLFGGEGFTPDMFDMGDVSDIFEMFFGSPFGRRRSRRQASRGRDLHMETALTFEEAAFGVEKEVEVRTLAVCDDCGGSGRVAGSEPVRCSHCGGSGEVSDVRRSVFGTVMTSRVCATCSGSGEEIRDPCPACRGEGRVPRPRTITVEVPAGVADGVELRIEGGGEQGRRGTPPGDLYLALRVTAHPVFERRGQDLVAVLEVALTSALLGATVEIETLDGAETVEIAAGTQPGTVIRLSGRGIPHLGRRGRGDLYVELEVQVPPKLSRKERVVVEELARLRGETPGDGRASLRRPR